MLGSVLIVSGFLVRGGVCSGLLGALFFFRWKSFFMATQCFRNSDLKDSPVDYVGLQGRDTGLTMRTEDPRT